MIKINDFSPETIEIVKKIERRAYEGTDYAQMQDITDASSLADYCEESPDKIDLYLSYNERKDEGIYMLISEHSCDIEIVDFAKTEGFSGLESGMFIMRALKELEKREKEITVDARESTSYPILVGLHEKGLIDITRDDSYEWDDETFHSMDFAITLSKDKEKPFEISR